MTSSPDDAASPPIPPEPACVLYNGSCPICAHEIGLYREAAERSGAALVFRDVTADAGTPAGMDPETLLRRMHVVDGAGRVSAGIDAFIAVWEKLPGWRRLAPVARFGPAHALLELLYERVAAPWLYARHRRRSDLAQARPRH